MGIKFSMKDGMLVANSDHPAFTSILESEPEPEDLTKTHYSHQGYWVPNNSYCYKSYLRDRYNHSGEKWIEAFYIREKSDYESYENFEEEAKFHFSLQNHGGRKSPKERETWKMMQDRVNAMRAKNGRP